VRALELREPALAIVRALGQWRDNYTFLKMFVAYRDGLTISYISPFQNLPALDGKKVERLAALGIPHTRPMPHLLGIWAHKGHVD
jgi:hypothetical protein